MSCEPALALPDKIRAARKRAGFSSQAAFGQALGTTRIHVNAWETGRNSPSFNYAQKIAELLGGQPTDWMAPDGPRGRDVAVVQILEENAALSREILELLTEIRDYVARPASVEDRSSP